MPDLAYVVNDNAGANEICVETRPSGSDCRENGLRGFTDELNVPPQSGGSVELEQQLSRFFRCAWHPAPVQLTKRVLLRKAAVGSAARPRARARP